MPKPPRRGLFPLELTPELTARGVDDLVKALLEESDRQVSEKQLKDDEVVDEFRMACDSLGCWRMALRFGEETNSPELDDRTHKVFRELVAKVAAAREYTLDDFESALQATKARVKLPWGYNSLRLAFNRTKRKPIRLLKPELAESPLLTLIAGIAFELDQMRRPDDPLLLPVDNLRDLLETRKLVVGGAISRLIEAKIIEPTTKRYHTGKAREFKFSAKMGKDFEVTHEEPADDREPSPKK